MNLVRKELKVKYTASVLGAIWSVLNPVVYLAVFTFVSRVLGNSLPNYPVYLLSGLLAWNLFSVSISQAARSVIDNSNLVKKVYFPREILPLSSIGVALVDFVLQEVTLIFFMVVTGYAFNLVALALWPLAFATLLVFTTAEGTPVRFSNFARRHLAPLVKAAGLPASTTFHGLRHTAATLLLAAGVDVKSAQAVLGHAKASHTLDLYADSVPGNVEAAMRRLGDAL